MKTLCLPLAIGVLASSTAPLHADLVLELSSHKAYRQKNRQVKFRGGVFDTNLRDGDGVWVCARQAYWPPNVPLDPCPGGSTGFVTFGSLAENEAPLGPYFWFTDVIPAVLIEPRREDLCFLKAAPYSTLKRPSADLADDSYGLYYNLHTNEVNEYVITRYETQRLYNRRQREAFEDDIVIGAYYYSFPRLGDPVRAVVIPAQIYPMPEGYTKVSNQKVGVHFVDTNRFNRNGFMELSYNRPNQIKWKGITPQQSIAAVDNLYFSIRYMANPRSSNSRVRYTNPAGQPASIFPGFVSGRDPRVLLRHPFVKQFNLPPIFRSGTKGIIELELDRGFMTSQVTADYSTRIFQMPVLVVNRYREYAEIRLPKRGPGRRLKDDYDGDGYNNMTEWILESRAEDPNSIPIPPYPVGTFDNTFAPPLSISYGFTIQKQVGTIPKVRYILQRSQDNGRTWQRMVSDTDWNVEENYYEIAVTSLHSVPDPAYDPIPVPLWIQPPGTANDIYRTKIVEDTRVKK